MFFIKLLNGHFATNKKKLVHSKQQLSKFSPRLLLISASRWDKVLQIDPSPAAGGAKRPFLLPPKAMFPPLVEDSENETHHILGVAEIFHSSSLEFDLFL